MIVPGGTLLRGFTNEATMFGFTRETRPAPDGTPRCNYSIRDDTTGSCWPLPETDFSDFDVVGHIILGSFANYGHLQKTHYDRHISGNGLGNRDGFALTFPITFD